MSKRIYVVEDSVTGETHLVRAATTAGAVRALLASRFHAEVASQESLVRMVKAGVPVVDNNEPGEPEQEAA